MQFSPSLDEASLPPRQLTSYYLDGIKAEYSNVILIVRVEVRPVVSDANFHVHTDDDAMETAQFGHIAILSDLARPSLIAAPRHTPESKQAMHQAAEARTPLR
jgi:hypothetical protein